MELGRLPDASQDWPSRLLSLHDDALGLICDAISGLAHENVVNFSSTCKRLREIAGPYAFRRTRTLTDCADGYSRLPSINPWLTVMEDPENAHKWPRYMRILKIKMVAMLERDVSRLATILAQAKHLDQLELSTPKALETNQNNLRKVMIDANIKKLKSFTTTAGLEDLISSLEIEKNLTIRNEPSRHVDPFLLEHFAVEARLRHIVKLQLDASTYWTPGLIKAIADNAPNLRNLATVTGGMHSFAFEPLIQQSSPFSQLKRMTVATVEWLTLRQFTPVCSLPRANCDPPHRFCSEHARQAFQYAGKLVLTAYPDLELLRFTEEKLVKQEQGPHQYRTGVVMEFRPAQIDGQRTMHRQYRAGTSGAWKTVYD